ncbi:hypothetical protein AQUCO_03800153v1 [Aquilegia coerulea]|uniref:Uncharacterized protein n=1 Tax=Aquilegia coerulea TaxID=218851 RepID=A0A2G5CSU2_AQUCA|nr:hypothetical protein AQUCO_03800153v1 [Aquilegia coerulea]
MKMIVTVEDSTIVQPFEETPKLTLWTSNVDQLFKVHIPSVYFFKPNGSSNFFNADLLKGALSKVLVPFYPVAGRLKKDKNGRLEIECNGEGALFVEAYTKSNLADLGDFEPSMELMQLIPRLGKGQDIYSSPFVLLQVTYFNCGGVSLGVAAQHTVVDGIAGTQFINSWARVARGLDVKIPPSIDRTLLHARQPPTPSFPHTEHQPPPTVLKTSNQKMETQTSLTAVATFKITGDQINTLKSKCNNELDPIKFSSYEVLAGHVWRCASKARNLENDQETSVSILVDGRTRLNPPLPFEYLGNAIFHVTPRTTSGDIVSKPLFHAVRIVHDTLALADDKYLRSALDYLEMQPDLSSLVRGPHTFGCPNLGFTSWCRLPLYDADFGWGKPVYMGPGCIIHEGLAYVLPSSSNDGNLSIIISLQSDYIVPFEQYLYEL